MRYRVVSSSNSIERSDDGGLTWRRTGPAPVDPVSIVAVVGGAPDGRVYVGSGDVAGLVDNIRDLQQEKGCTVLMVEHHIDVLMGLVDRVAVMYFGSIIAYDTPQNIMNDPLVQSAYLGRRPIW